MRTSLKRLLAMLLAMLLVSACALADVDDLEITKVLVDPANAKMSVIFRVGSEVGVHQMEENAAFTISNKAVKPVEDSLKTDLGVGYILVIDRSGYYSAYMKYEQVKQTALQIIQTVPSQDRVAIVFVDSGIECNDTFMLKAAAETTVSSSFSPAEKGNQTIQPTEAMVYQGLSKALQLAGRTGSNVPEQKVIVLLSDFGADDDASIRSNVLSQLDTGRVPLITVPFYCVNYQTTQKSRVDAMNAAAQGRSELLGRSSLNCEITIDGSNGSFDASQSSKAAAAVRQSVHFASIDLDIMPLFKAGAAVEEKELRITFDGNSYSERFTLNAAAIATPVSVATPTPTPDPNPIIVQFGDENATVLKLQQILTELYYYEGELNRKFDNNVQVALMNLCQDNGLEFSDALRQDVWNLLQSGMIAPKATPTPAPTFTPAPTRDPELYLAMGDNDVKVYTLQKKLVSLGYLDESDVSRVYDDATQVAVYEFYEGNGMPLRDGLTLAAWNRLQSGNALPKATATPTPAPTEAPTPTPDPNQKFAVGDSSGELRSLQSYLISHYYLDEKYRSGVFDENTQWAVDAFCEVNGIPIYDNGMSVEAWDKLQSGYALANPTATPEPTFTPAPTRDPSLKFVLDEVSSDVITLQNRLVEMFYLDPELVSGAFDQKTLIAVVNFCNINGIATADGMTHVAWNYLMTGSALPNPTATPKPTEAPTAVPTAAPTAEPEFMDIQPGDSNRYVRKYQEQLVKMGYLTAAFTAGTYDEATQAAQDLMCQYNNLNTQVGADVNLQQFVFSSTLKDLSQMGFMDKLEVQLSDDLEVGGLNIPLWIPACAALVIFLVVIVVILCMPGKKRKKQSGKAAGGSSSSGAAQQSAAQAALVSTDKPTDAIDTSSDVPTSENVNDWQVVLTISYMGAASDYNYTLNDGMPIYIGRGSGSDVLLNANDTQASRKHGTLVHRGNQLFYADTSSKGSRVDGEFINNAERPVHAGSIIEISRHTIRINA